MNPGSGFSIAFGRAREASSTSPPSDETARREVEALHKPQSNGKTAGSKSGLADASFRAPFCSRSTARQGGFTSLGASAPQRIHSAQHGEFERELYSQPLQSGNKLD